MSEDTQRLLRIYWLKLIASLVALMLAFGYLSREHSGVPALGPLLSPFHGIWNHREPFWETKNTTLSFPGLKEKVEVVVDEDQVKHIFAQNDDDLYMAEGFVLASERLWEMEFLSRVASGRLSEVMGPRSLEYDKYFVKMGVPQAAKESSELMLNDPVTAGPLKAYTKGVNAYIASLGDDDLPFEYKLLNQKPEPWNPVNAAYILKFMAYDLSAYNRELPLTRSRSMLSKDDFDDLFPLDLAVPEPIIPRGTKFGFPSRAPEPPAQEFLADLKQLEPLPQPHAGNGSNNWAVAGKKSVTGKPILSNDIHLGLSLPALWYEVQLVSPTQNVYGITLPGAPGIILGFNEKLAWAVTNGGTDVMDWYQLRYRDQNRSEYLFEGDWRPVISREMQIKVRGEAPVNLLLRQTHFGPVVYDQSETPLSVTIPRGLAMHWSALEPSNEIKSFLLLNKAKNLAQCREAIETFQTPDRNFLCADQTDIALFHMGRYPVRWKGQGRMISDGSQSAYEWHGWLPRTEIPMTKNPERGFVSSANQMPTDENYPHYLGWPFESPFRALRMNEILREKKKFSPEDLMKMQGDTVSVLARTALPLMLKQIEGEPTLHESTIEPAAAAAQEVLRKWDFKYDESSDAATIFEAWFDRFLERLWQPRFPDHRNYQYPPILRTLKLMAEDPSAKWFDNPKTPETEHFKEVALASFKDALKDLQIKFGALKTGKWRWPLYQLTELQHVSKIPGLGSKPFAAPGVAESLFANHGNHGPVWKLVVALGPHPKAWSVYPGGQSGDPASRHYDDFVNQWRKNEFKEVLFLESPEDGDSRFFKRVTMTSVMNAQGEGK